MKKWTAPIFEVINHHTHPSKIRTSFDSLLRNRLRARRRIWFQFWLSAGSLLSPVGGFFILGFCFSSYNLFLISSVNPRINHPSDPCSSFGIFSFLFIMFNFVYFDWVFSCIIRVQLRLFGSWAFRPVCVSFSWLSCFLNFSYELILDRIWSMIEFRFVGQLENGLRSLWLWI